MKDRNIILRAIQKLLNDEEFELLKDCYHSGEINGESYSRKKSDTKIIMTTAEQKDIDVAVADLNS